MYCTHPQPNTNAPLAARYNVSHGSLALLAVGGQQAADYDARALVVRALERATWNDEQDFEARYPA